jgi:hypothetical protein
MLDVMSTQKGALGFSNRWYEGAIQTATPASLPSGKVIRLITAPFFLGTKWRRSTIVARTISS